MYCPNCNKEYDGKFCPECGARLIEKPSAGGFNINLGDANAISGGVNLSDSHNDNSRHFDQRGQTNYNAQGGITITNQAAQTTEQDVTLKKEERYRAACRRFYEDFVIDDVEIKQLKGLAQDLGLSDDRAMSILNGVKQQMDAERAREEALNPRAQKRLQRLLSSMRENDVEAVVDQLESFDEMVTEKNISDLHFIYYLAQAALNHKKCIALSEKSITDSYWRSYWSYVAYMKNGNKKEATRILDRIELKFSDYSIDNTALLASVGELMQGKRKAADNEFLDVNESNLSPRLQRLFEALLLILDPAEAKENNLREKDYLFYLKHIFNCETTEEREKREREEEVKRKAEAEERRKKELEAQRKREEEERKRKAAEERLRKEAEAKRKREEEERRRAEEQKRREEEARRRAAEIEAKRKTEEEPHSKAAEININKEREKQIIYTVILKSVTNNMLAMMTARSVLNWTIAESKQRFDNLPYNVLVTTDEAEAKDACKKLSNGGMTAVIERHESNDEKSLETIGGNTIQDKVDVILENCGSSILLVTKEIMSCCNLGLKEAKNLADGAPTVLINNIIRDEAQEIKQRFERIGAIITIK